MRPSASPPDLLLPGDLYEGRPGDLPVPPALVPDLLGKAVHQQDLVDRLAGLADDPGQLFLVVLLLLHEPLQGFGLFDGREVLAEQVLNQGDFGGVARKSRGSGLAI